MSVTVCVVFLLYSLSIGPAQAKRSDQCPGGCVIASVLFPVRRCICVVPKCGASSTPTDGTTAAVAAVSRPDRGRGTRRIQAQGADCDFCKRDAFTYSSYAECMAADREFRPSGTSIDAKLYPSLAPSPGHDGAVSSMSVGVSQVCPPPFPDECRVSDFLTWESVFSDATTSTEITIPAGRTVVLHGCAQPANTVSVKSITIPAGSTLIVSDSPLTLNLQHIAVLGAFRMGLPSCPIKSQIIVNIPGGNERFGVDVAPGATYDVHGYIQGPTWTRVSTSVAANSNIINLMDRVDWAPEDKIVLVTTTWKDELLNQNEVMTITAISNDGLRLTTKERTQFHHYGGEYKAEVGLLTRRILFTSDERSTASRIGPHTTCQSPDCRVSGAAFERWGAVNRPGRYPLHFHIVGEAPQAHLKNNAIVNSNWRCITIHGTNAVTIFGNVGFNVHGHCYYLEDGVEERNVIERNLAAYIHPISMAGSGGGQQGTDRWSSGDLFDPSDAGASGFYALNAYNVWRDNAASGGFAGFTFPNAPRAIKDHKNIKKADGFPFVPSERPLMEFKGNTAHSTGWAWEHAACFYFGGMLIYKVDPADGQEKLFYNNGRGPIETGTLCPDPNWPQSDGDNWQDCWVGSSRRTKSADGMSDGFLLVEDATAALCNVGIGSWGERIEVKNLQGFDVTRGSEYLGQSWMTNSYFKINTNNIVSGGVGWPYEGDYWWEAHPVKGFEWYDTMTSTLLSNVTFENYKYKQYTDNPDNWWYWQTPSAFRMLSHSDQYKPDKTMMVTKGITCKNCDLGTCTGGVCAKSAFFRVDQKYTGASWLHNWLDADGSVVRHVARTKPPGPYLITSQPDWWRLNDVTSWREPRFNDAWVTPMPDDEVAARIEMRVENNGQRYTLGAFDGSYGEHQQGQRIGYVSQFGDVSKYVVMTRIEGTTGMTGNTGWYTVWNVSRNSYHAPKRLELVMFNVPRNKAVNWASCWPAGTTFTVAKQFSGSAECQTILNLAKADSREALLAGGGDTYHVDNNNCLHLKLTDPGQPWLYTSSFERDGLYIEEEVRWFSLSYIITATGPLMSCGDMHFCTLPGDPASRVPAVVPRRLQQSPQCVDKQPPGGNCPAVKCNWADGYWTDRGTGCQHPDIIAGGYCQASCRTCPVLPPVPSATLTVTVTLTSSLTSNNRFRICTATVTVIDATTGKQVAAGLRVSGRWSRSPAGSSSGAAAAQRWPYTMSAVTTKAGARVRAVLRSANLPKAPGNSCSIRVISVSGMSGYSVNWSKSTRQATTGW